MISASPSQNQVRRQPESAPRSQITPEFALNVLRRWWAIVIPVGIVVGCIPAAYLLLTFSPRFEAKVLVRLAQHDPYLVESRGNGYVSSDFAADQMGLVRSTLVLGPTASRPEVLAALPKFSEGDDAIAALRELIGVGRAWGNEHFYITASSLVPAHAATIANSVTESYLSLVGEFDAGRDKRLITLLQSEMDKSKRQVEQIRENVRQLTIEQTGKDPFSRHPELEMSNFPLANLQNQLATIGLEESVLRLQIKAQEEFTAKNPSGLTDAMVDRALDQNEQLARFRSLMEAKQALAEEIKSKAADGEKSPRYLELAQQLKADEQEMVRLKGQLRTKVREQLTEQATKNMQASIAESKARLADYLTRKEVLTKAFEEEVAKITKFSGANLALEIKRSELARAEMVLDRLSERVFMLQTEQRAPDRIEVLEKAAVPTQPMERIPMKKLLMTFGAAFFAPYCLALLSDLRVRRVGTAEQLQERGTMTVVGEIATLPTNAGQNRYFGKQRANRDVRLFEESVESLRICLLMTKSLKDVQTLAVCSAASQEGKTTLATQLAISIARSADGLTLLVDGDMRAPDVHSIFEVENKQGLAEVLSHQCDLADAIVPSWDARLHLLPGGKLRSRPHELVKGGAFAELLVELRKKYRYIVIDTPPVLPAGESLIMAAAADATLVCARRDHSREDQVRKTHERLVAAGANVAGCVFSGLPLAKYKYRYGGYYYGEQRG